MPFIDEYQNLLKDTHSFLKNTDKKLIESNSYFFEKDLLDFMKKKIKKSNVEIFHEEKKYNIDVQNSQINEKQNEFEKEKEIKSQNIDTTNVKESEKPHEKNQKFNNFVQKDIESKRVKNVSFTLETPANKDIKSKESLENKKIIRDEKPKIFEDNFIDIKNSIEKVFPNVTILEKPYDDKVAKQKSQKYKFKNISSPITILAYKEDEKFYRFLEKLSIALSVYFYPSKVISAYLIEKENSWDNFLTNDISLIISSDYTIFELEHLRSFYKENPSKGEKFIKDIPLFLLPDINLYLKEPSLKKSLFKALKQKISTIAKLKNYQM